MAKDAPELAVHKEWLGQIQQVGLVVSPHVLAKHGVGLDRHRSVEIQTRLREIVSDSTGAAEDTAPRVDTFLDFASTILEWPEGLLAGAPGGADVPGTLTVALPEYEDRLSPAYAIPGLLLVSVVPTGSDLDKPLPEQKTGWRASPHARLERLLRETGVPIGLLFNHTHLRLVYAPRGESSGHLTFRFKHLLETLGRPMAGALDALLGAGRVTDVLPDAQRLPALLAESRKYQNVVSTRLAEQVLEALWDLLRGFQRANDDTNGQLLAESLREDPQEVYGGLLSTLMRLVFILYAEDRGLMPPGDIYQKHYSVSGLFERLREDAALYPDTMDARFGAWAQLLALFRLIHDGGGHGSVRFPPRHGRLFDPDVYPFLEGRPFRSTRVIGQPIDPPRVPDGVVFRVLQNLLMLDGERLSYRALDVEQIGSVYEAMMGFALRQAAGPSIALRPKHIVVNLAELLEQKPKDRAAWLQKQAELKVTGNALANANTVDDLLAALGRKVSRRYTPAPLPAAAMYLQPTEERRRSGSHYTPRSLTAPIVETTFRPIFERLGDRATPEQILDLKVCDPAMGSGAFLVEACRLLADRLVKAWEIHPTRGETVPPSPRLRRDSPADDKAAAGEDEDALTYARRLVAERCLYGVDKNVFAVDLAKLSLWLATLARDHPFTFLDHALRHGDSLVGLSREQIACFNWEADRQLPLLRGLIDARVAQAQDLRLQIQRMADSDDVPEKARLLKEANEALGDVRAIGDLAVSAFFEREKASERRTLRVTYAAQVERWLAASVRRPSPLVSATASRAPDLPTLSLDPTGAPLTFHWEIEFPEVFTRASPGFDAFVGNPPFMSGTMVSASLGMPYFQWLTTLYAPAGHLCDLVGYFFRRVYDLLRTEGAFGLVATNTIAQGDTRNGSLGVIRASGATIYAATRRVKWPGGAAVHVSVVHVFKGRYEGDMRLDSKRVSTISAYLFSGGPDEDPIRLSSNSPLFSAGSKIYGQGFVFDDSDAEASPIAEALALKQDPRYASRVLPYIGGEELNQSPDQSFSRYVINLSDVASESELSQWPALEAIVRAKVKPGRDALGNNPNNIPLKRRWWAYQAHRPRFYSRLSGLQRTLANSQISSSVAFAFQPVDRVFSHALNLFAFESDAAFAVMQSRVHEVWARFLGSSMKDDLRYTPSDCFETFPFPADSESNADLESAGRKYYAFRAALMARDNQGLTKTYNRFHDPDENDPQIKSLRDLHAAMDRAVLDAYGWTDIQPSCEFILDYEDEEDDDSDGRPSRRKKPWRYRWPDEIRDEVLGRLLALNKQRAEVERLAGSLAAERPPAPRAAARRSPTRTGQPDLLGDAVLDDDSRRDGR